MFKYRIDRQQNDGSWSVQEFQSVDDTDAITYGLRVRTANRCELYEADRWLATFDGVAVANNLSSSHANENTNRSFVEMETEVAYFHRRARLVEAARRRLTFYDVNASRGENRRPPTAGRLCR